MAARVNPNVTPRLITVPTSDGTELTMQQLVTQTRDWEDEPSSLSYPFIMSASGKEDLGGGTSVGITTQLQNARLAFEQRGASVSSGTVTTIDTTGFTLIDSAATFIADGVIEGAAIVNFTDQSVGTVLSIDSEIQITLLSALEDGTDDQWDSADVYKIWNIIQCEASGGNLTAVDGAGDTAAAIFPTFGTQIVRTSSSSATLQEQADIQFSSFGGRVSVDITSIYSGTSFPVGTPRQPVNNIPDAIIIAATRGFKTLLMLTDITLDTGDIVDDCIIEAETTATHVHINAGASTVDSQFHRCHIEGTLDGGSAVHHSAVGNLLFVDGTIHNSALGGTITLSGSNNLSIHTCHEGSTAPSVDFGGTGSALFMRDYSGKITLTNKSGADVVSLDMSSGEVILESSVTSGTITIRGIASITDNSVGATVIDKTISQETIAAKVWAEDMRDINTPNTVGHYLTQKLFAKFEWLIRFPKKK